MRERVGKFPAEYIKENYTVLFLLLIVFVVGVTAGALTASTLDNSQKSELFKYINGFLEAKDTSITHGELFRQIFLNHTKLIISIWFLGLTIVGMPLIIGLLGFKGFTMGFTVAFMLDVFTDMRGLLIILSSIIPQALIILPCITVISVSGIKLSLSLLKGGNTKSLKKSDIKIKLFFHTMLSIIVIGLVAIESSIEMTILPMFLKIIYSNFY